MLQALYQNLSPAFELIEEVNFYLLNALPPEWVDPYQHGLFEQWRKIHPELMRWKIGSHEMIPPDEVGVLPMETLFGRPL